MDPTPQNFFSVFTPDVVEIIVEAIRHGYESASERHDEAIGGDEQLFGFMVHKYGQYAIERALSSSANGALHIESKSPLRIADGPFEIACHRVAGEGRADIRASFPRNDGAIGTMVPEQLDLFSSEERIESASKIVLAHMGNAQDGFGALYACVIGGMTHGRVSSWLWTQPLWTAYEGIIVEQPSAAADAAAVENVVPFALKKKTKPQTDEDAP